MSSEDSLLEIIKSLADQVSSRDIRIRDQRQQSDEQLAELKSQYESVRTEREGLRIQRDALEGELQAVKLLWSSEVNALKLQVGELAKERAEVRTTHELEKADLRNKNELLEQAVQYQTQLLSTFKEDLNECRLRCNGQTQSLSKSQEDLNESRLLCNTAMEGLKSQSEKWSLRLSQILMKLDQLSESRQTSGIGPSITAIPSASPNKQLTSGRSVIQSSDTPISLKVGSVAAKSTPKTDNNTPIVHNNKGETASGSPKRHNSTTHEQREPGPEAGGLAMIPRSVLAPGHVFFRAESGVKEEDHEDEDRSLISPRVAAHCNAVQVLPQENGSDEPSPKRRRINSWKRSSRRIDDEDEDGSINSSEAANASSKEEPEDHDEMAIGAEEDPKEIYGHRKVNVPKKLSRSHIPPLLRPHTRTGGSGMSSGVRRKVGPNGLKPSPNDGQPSPVRTKR
ncbi:hypothetical protein BU17DRAFT_100547 [Hysterangium stoloniferum]|nr:hypothetical protein BU17DRAFT_100547 [Hysterangium stoloniferum]